MPAQVDNGKCTGCESCTQECPSSAITMDKGKAKINPDSCVNDSFLMPIDNYEVWDNSADCGYLYNYANINEVSKFCYGQ